MALTSPGVELSVIDESFYTAAEPGTRPLMIVATAANKPNASRTGTAPGTLASNKDRVFIITSQRELVETFGDPIFRVDSNNNAIHGSELNEYGLQAAYSFLGVSNSALILRADVDLAELTPSPNAPGGRPQNGTFWLDTATTQYGIFQWDGRPNTVRGGQTFTSRTPIVITDQSRLAQSSSGPKQSVGVIGDYAIVVGNDPLTDEEINDTTSNVEQTDSHVLALWYKNRSNQWVKVGDEDWKTSWPVVTSTNANAVTNLSGSFTINNITISGSSLTDIAQMITDQVYSLGISAAVINNILEIYSVADNGGTASGPFQTFVVTSVANPGTPPPNRIYQINGQNYPVLNLVRGGTYTFNQSDATNATHQIAFRDAAGNPFTQGVVSSGVLGTPGAQTVFTVPSNAPSDLRYYCVQHGNGMGNVISVTGSSSSYSSTVVVANVSGTLLADIGLAAGEYRAPALAIRPHTQVPEWRRRDTAPRPSGSVWIKTTEPNAGARWRLRKYNSGTEQFAPVEVTFHPSNQAALAALDPNRGGLDIAVDRAYVQHSFTESSSTIAEFRIMRRARPGPTVVRSREIMDVTGSRITAGIYPFVISESTPGSATLNSKNITVTVPSGAIGLEEVASAISAAGLSFVVAEVINNRVVISHTTGGEIRFADVNDSTVANNFVSTILQLDNAANNVNVYRAKVIPGVIQTESVIEYIASNWIPLTITPDTATLVRQSYFIQSFAPNTLVDDGKLWYSSIVDQVDIMVHNGQTWVGYRNYDHGTGLGNTDMAGPMISATEPQLQSDDTPLQDGDIWINTSDLENYPAVYRYSTASQRWGIVDKSDQTSESGMLFADARWNATGASDQPAAISTLLTSNFLDFDTPDPSLFPRGMLLWNLRRSGFNVKKFVKNYVNISNDNLRYKASQSDGGFRPTSGDSMVNYYPHRWVTASGNQSDGSGSFGRKSQRKVIQQQLQAIANSNQDIRDTERFNYNLMSCPGYPELIGEMIGINFDRGLTSFIVGDTPCRLPATATSLNEWGSNRNGAVEDNDFGLVSSDEYLGMFYPWGFTSDNFGRDIVVPPSHMILRMMALNDQVAYPWFAPAGTRRGGITNATSVGFVNSEGEFRTVALNEGQRDTLYNLKINPITFFVGSGLVNFGQKTRAGNDSALDRINVSRLVIHLRSQLNRLAKPYIFEPNDKITRDEIKAQVESLLLELVGLRAIYDFLVVCDESNNTPQRIDKNELYVDVAIEPVKAIEFIYIPLRIKNTGELSAA